jgi:hypothetical protein
MSKESPVEIEISLQQHYTQRIDVVNRILGLVPIGELIGIFEYLDLFANPRDAKKSTITEAIQKTLTDEAQIFPLKSKGLLISGAKFVEKSNGRVSVWFEDLSRQGIIDGGHNSFAIGQFILNKALEFSSETYRSKAKNWTDFKREFVKFKSQIDAYAASERGVRELSTLITIEILVPASEKPDDLQQFNFALEKIQSARNNNAQVSLSAIMNNEGLYSSLRKNLPKELDSRVAWRTNDGNVLKPEDIVSLTWIPLNALLLKMKSDNEYFLDSNGKKIQPLNPPQIYSSKNSCVKQYKKFSEGIDVGNSTIEIEMLDSLYKMSGEMPEIFDLLYKDFPIEFDRFSTKKFRSIEYVKVKNASSTQKKTPFYGYSAEYAFPEAYIYPLIYSLHKLIRVGKTLEWIEDPRNFLKKNLAQILGDYNEAYLRQLKYEPQQVGKKKDIYTYLEKVIEGLSRRV